MTARPDSSVVQAMDVFKRRRPVKGVQQQEKLSHVLTDKRAIPSISTTEGASLHRKADPFQMHMSKSTKSFEQQVVSMFNPRRFSSCYRCFEIQYLLYLAFRDMVSSFKTKNATMNMPWGSTPSKPQLTALRRVMRCSLNKLADECFADARKDFSKTAYAAAAPIYEIHEATGFCLERLTNAASFCNKLLIDQKKQSASMVQLARQLDTEIDELAAENNQLEEKLQRTLNN
ncbi:hypothetical protein GL50803_0014248 [Giardia duodenalis]|uniref:Uncharacterized protein n=1 Tax=Giardia intestinalis (strain ATCC 50803 / WB clone C6) TaxID=184922 RepID=D3KFZ6_GIAIC|nr:hypothetical protein GL50803_0014248 [Giardia intestinalis]KAE8302918.1 hypothetical protein GL50803_0014248 [Giardia intestinalis]